MYYLLPAIDDATAVVSAFQAMPVATTVLDASNNCNAPIESIESGLASMPGSVKFVRFHAAFFDAKPIDEVVRILKALPKSITSLDLSFCFEEGSSIEGFTKIIQAIPEQVTVVGFQYNNITLHEDSQDCRFRTHEEIMTIIQAFRPTLAGLDLRGTISRHLEHIDEYQRALSSIKDVYLDYRAETAKTAREIRLMEYMRTACANGPLITALAFNPHISSTEERLLELLLSPETREYAHEMVALTSNTDSTPQQNRKLQLLLDPNTKEYAARIIALEEKMAAATLSAGGMQALSVCYLGQIVKTDLPALSLEKVISHFASALLGPPKPALPDCHALSPFTTYSPCLYVRWPSPYALMDIRINTIEKAIGGGASEILEHYLRDIPQSERTKPSMQVYTLDKKQLLNLSLKKYFASSETPEFSDINLALLVSSIKEALSARTLVLSNREALLDLEHTIPLPSRPTARMGNRQ